MYIYIYKIAIGYPEAGLLPGYFSFLSFLYAATRPTATTTQI